MKWTKETTKRVLRTFAQAALSYIGVNLFIVDFSAGKEVIKSALIGLLISALSAGISAVMNLQSTATEELGAGGYTFDDFVKAYLGKSTDYDGVSGVQCVDLIKVYLDKLFGIKPGAWGNAKDYWLSFSSRAPLVQNFTKIEYKAGLIPQKGDIVVWNAGISSGGYGHVAIATGEGNGSEFYTYDQNWGGKPMKKVKHTYSHLYGFLRPKNQSNIVTAASTASESYPTAVAWKNGRTKETVYKEDELKEDIGTISPWEAAKCYGKIGDSYIVVYDLDGSSKHKAGFVGYAGGVKTAPTGGKTYKNGSTSETVYADTAKKTKVGSLDPNEKCTCLGKIDDMYLVLYKVNNTSYYKCGFVD